MKKIIFAVCITLSAVITLIGYFYLGNIRYHGTYNQTAPVVKTENRIFITYPKAHSVVRSPFTIEGSARGNWFFEASFPVKLLDESGVVLATTHAEAESNWMTTDFVPYHATLAFEKPKNSTHGTLVLEKDNSSGLPEYDAEIRIPVLFGEKKEPEKICKKTGCSGQICSDQDVISTCEWREEYTCYKNAVCERTVDGVCGWRETPELAACLQTIK